MKHKCGKPVKPGNEFLHDFNYIGFMGDMNKQVEKIKKDPADIKITDLEKFKDQCDLCDATGEYNTPERKAACAEISKIYDEKSGK